MKLFNEIFDAVISLGCTCRCAKHLSSMSLRQFSSPFDWVMGSTFECRIDMLCTGFSKYLKYENLVPREDSPDSCEGHRSVDDVKYGFAFLHDFPNLRDVAETYPAVKAKYDRRIKRLLDVLHGDNRVCFVWWSHDQVVDDAVLIESIERIDRVFKARIDFLIIENGPSKTPELHRLAEDRIVRIRCSLVTSEYDLFGDKRRCRKIFLALRVKGCRWKQLSRSFRLGLSNLLSFYIPSRRLRRRFRDFLRSGFLESYEY